MCMYKLEKFMQFTNNDLSFKLSNYVFEKPTSPPTSSPTAAHLEIHAQSIHLVLDH